jgi:hypothetical protein
MVDFQRLIVALLFTSPCVLYGQSSTDGKPVTEWPRVNNGGVFAAISTASGHLAAVI